MSAADFNFHRDEFLRLFSRTLTHNDLTDPSDGQQVFETILAMPNDVFMAHLHANCFRAGCVDAAQGQAIALSLSHLIAARLANGAA